MDRLVDGPRAAFVTPAAAHSHPDCRAIPILIVAPDVSEPEPNLNGRRLQVNRGKVIGGSSSVNLMLYTRGDRSDFDRWARNGATGWSFADLLPYFMRSENWRDGEVPWRGASGPLGTQWGQKRHPITGALFEAAPEAGWPVRP